MFGSPAVDKCHPVWGHDSPRSSPEPTPIVRSSHRRANLTCHRAQQPLSIRDLHLL